MISVLFPTIRPTSALASLVSVAEAAQDVLYEVIVVADFEYQELGCCDPIAHLNCRWLMRNRQGPTHAANVAYEQAHGMYAFVFNDESTLAPGMLKLLHAAAVAEPDVLYSPRSVPAYNFVYYGKPFVPFPFAHRDVFTKLGGLFDPIYKAFYADPDLGMRAHARGVPVKVVEQAVIHHNNGDDAAKQENVKRYMSSDQATFRARWDHLGEFRDC